MLTKILTVDDSKTIRLLVARAFKPFDCQIHEASNGVEGLAVATREKPDLIILDITMPVMDGYETLTRLKSNPDLKNIPVVMLTAEAGRENVLKIARLGVRDYLIKPFKEEQIVERAGRIVDLKPRGEALQGPKRFDDALRLLVVDDKPAIHDVIRQGLADTKWTVDGRTSAEQAIEFCSSGAVPDAVLVSLSLPDNASVNLFHMLRASVMTKNVPIFAMSVKTALDEQVQATHIGFNGVITKPIDINDLKARITRVLNLDTSYKYYEIRQGVMVLSLPQMVTPVILNEALFHLRSKLVEAVDSGVNKLIVDFSQVQNPDVGLIKLGLSTLQYCGELSVRHGLVGSDAVCKECKKYEESKDWRFANSFDEGAAALEGKQLALA